VVVWREWNACIFEDGENSVAGSADLKINFL
jgi:hypothetical protein